jgi:hypothetical protein
MMASLWLTLGQIVPRCGVELRQAVHCEIAGVEATHLTRYRLQIMVVELYRLDPHAFEPEVEMRVWV